MRLFRIGSLLGAVALSLASADVPVDAAALPGVIVLRDGDGATLTVQSNRNAPDAGAFTIVIPGTAAYQGVDRATIRDSSVRHFAAAYHGPADLYLVVQEQPIRVTLDVNVEVEIDDGGRVHGQADIDAGDRKLHLQVVEMPRQVPVAMLSAFEAGTRSADWDAIYGMLGADFTRNVSAGAFAAAARTQTSALGPITNIRRMSAGSPQVNELGVIFAVVQYTVTRAGPHGETSAGYVAYFVYENGQWRLWFTAVS